MSAGHLRSAQFRREREGDWRRLEKIVATVEKRGLRALGGDDLAALPVLYRSTLSSLSVARAISLDRNVLRYLEDLAQRAYLCVYTRRRHLREALAHFFLRGFPRAVRRFRWHVVVATLLLFGAIFAGHFLVQDDPETFHAFVDPAYAQGRGPEASPESLREVIFGRHHVSGAELGRFSLTLFAHNAMLALISFALGFALGIPVFLALMRFGLLIGAFTAIYARHGMGADLCGWLAPHGVTELLAIILASAGGLALSTGLLFPGTERRRTQLARVGRAAGPLAVGAVLMLLISGFLEGVVRQVVVSTPARFLVGGTTLALWIAYFTLAGRGEERSS